MPGNLVLAGYIGCGNLGDDAVMLGLVEGLRNDGFTFTIMSGSPEETYRNYSLRSIDRRNKRQFEEELARSDALVFPGGSIFQDVTSIASVKYYADLISKAKSMGKKVILVGQGIGPLNNFLSKGMATSALNKADAITVRDPGSFQTLRTLGVKTPIKVAADTSFLMPVTQPVEGQEEFSVGAMRTVGVSVRPFGKDKEVALIFGEFCRLAFTSGVMPVLIEMDRNEDGPLIMEIAKLQGGKIPDIRKLSTPMQIQQRMSRMDTVVAMRLHAGILASAVGVPPLMVSYDPKVMAFSRLLDLGSALSLEGLTGQRLFESYIAFQKDRDRNIKLVQKKREELVELARISLDTVRMILNTSSTL